MVHTKNSSIHYILGAYTPVTSDGNIVVDGVLASCYASAHHDLAHIGMTPIRWIPIITKWIFGNDTGSLVFVKVIEEFGRLVVPFWLTYGIN